MASISVERLFPLSVNRGFSAPLMPRTGGSSRRIAIADISAATAVPPNAARPSFEAPGTLAPVYSPLDTHMERDIRSAEVQRIDPRETPPHQPFYPDLVTDEVARLTSEPPPEQTKAAASPNERSLPFRDVTADNINEAFVQFIMYCNPSIPSSIDTAELRQAFRSPPRSDGKTFDTFVLYTLIRKLEDKSDRHLTTWVQLAMELGVEPPDLQKNQSVQKVQQYSVRLKRWMRALHVDAFFSYCLGTGHNYYQQIPETTSPFLEAGRGSVAPDEDTALRALYPESRPKRGRRKADDKENGSNHSSPTRKRAHVDLPSANTDLDGIVAATSAALFGNALASPYHQDDLDIEPLDPWTSASAINAAVSNISTPAPSTASSTQFRWRSYRDSDTTPITPHPLSAATPRDQTIFSTHAEPPTSATSSSPGKTKPRRKHGPAMSSAWSGTGVSAKGKLRGRPPSNRSVRDGPFSTFPANPQTKEGPTIELAGSQLSTPTSAQSDGSRGFASKSPLQQVALQPYLRPLGPRKPSGLQLMVPPNTGGAVRLATPVVYVNGEAAFVEDANRDFRDELTWDDVEDALLVTILESLSSGHETQLTLRNARPLATAIMIELGNAHALADNFNAKSSDALMRVVSFLEATVNLSTGSDRNQTKRSCSVNIDDLFIVQVNSQSAEGEVQDSTSAAIQDSQVGVPTDSPTTSYHVSWSLKSRAFRGNFELDLRIPEIPETKTSEVEGDVALEQAISRALEGVKPSSADDDNVKISKETFLALQTILQQREEARKRQ